MKIPFQKLSAENISYFEEIVGKENTILPQGTNFNFYTQDFTENLQFKPEIVLKPSSTKEVAQIVNYCNQWHIPITPSGGRTGLMGGALAIYGGVILSLERMNKILKIDTKNFQATVQAGVINFTLQQALEESGLFFPPDPSSWGSSLIGGNIATNAGGPKAVKYGVTGDYVLNLEVVLPNGEIIWTGANTFKNATAYDLTSLFIGSEGTLGVITQAVLKIQPKPKKDISLLIPFQKTEEAAQAVAEIFYAGIQPAALEFMERNALEAAIQFLSESFVKITSKTQAHLLVMLDGNDENVLLKDAERIIKAVEKFAIEEVQFADNETDKQRIWQLRRKVAEIVKAKGYTIEEDTVVPIAELPKLVEFAHILAKKNNCKVVCYGHAGDGNLHIRFNHPEHKHSYQNKAIQPMLSELFEFIKSLGGTISAEHGIGLLQKDFLPIVFGKANLQLQRNLKNAVDPDGIMNPGKLFDN